VVEGIKQPHEVIHDLGINADDEPDKYRCNMSYALGQWELAEELRAALAADGDAASAGEVQG
jgi:hypothetical protein